MNEEVSRSIREGFNNCVALAMEEFGISEEAAIEMVSAEIRKWSNTVSMATH